MEKEKEKLVYNIAEVSEILGIGKTLCYDLVRQGQIPALKLGRRILVPRIALENMLQKVLKSDQSIRPT